MSITTEITRLQNAKAALKGSIEAKGVTVASDATLDQYPALVDEIPQGGGGAAEKAVNFYDYDGTVVNSYTKSEFLQLQELPQNPDRSEDGLVSQGWNWSLSDAKNFLQNFESLNIGQQYVTNDGYTKLFIEVTNVNLPITITLGSGNYPFYLDWGDGSEKQKLTYGGQNASHSYQAIGNYTISIEGACYLNNSTSYNIFGYNNKCSGVLKGVFVGENTNYKQIRERCFFGCPFLEFFTIPKGFTTIGSYAFNGCKNLKCIILPEPIASLSDGAFFQCASLESAILPNSITSLSNASFVDCISLKSLTIPSSTACNGNFLGNTYSLTKLEIPDAVVISADSFKDLYSLKELKLPKHLTSIGNRSFAFGPTILVGNIKFELPETLETIGNMAFQYYCINELIIPQSVSSIGSSAFLGYINKVIMRSLTPPTIGSSVFQNANIIYVPAASLEDYKAASGWSTYADKIVAIPE